MKIAPLRKDVLSYLKTRGIEKKFRKQKFILENNPSHPGLGIELLEPNIMRIWSFRIDRKYRVLFIFRNSDTIEIIDVNNHYQ